MKLSINKQGVAGLLAGAMTLAHVLPAAASSYCVRFQGSFSNGQLNCPGQTGQFPGDYNTEGWGQGRISNNIKQVRVNLTDYADDYDYIAAYVYGARTNGELVVDCHAIRYEPGISAYDNCPSTAATFNLYVYAG